jgi:hypothetical protein
MPARVSALPTRGAAAGGREHRSAIKKVERSREEQIARRGAEGAVCQRAKRATEASYGGECPSSRGARLGQRSANYTPSTVAGLLVLLIPFLLLAFMLFMGRVEEPLRREAPERDVEEFLDEANPQELQTFVSEGTDSALKRFRNRLSMRRRKRA